MSLIHSKNSESIDHYFHYQHYYLYNYLDQQNSLLKGSPIFSMTLLSRHVWTRTAHDAFRRKCQVVFPPKCACNQLFCEWKGSEAEVNEIYKALTHPISGVFFHED